MFHSISILEHAVFESLHEIKFVCNKDVYYKFPRVLCIYNVGQLDCTLFNALLDVDLGHYRKPFPTTNMLTFFIYNY